MFRGLSIDKNCLRPECAPLTESSFRIVESVKFFVATLHNLSISRSRIQLNG